MKWAAVLICLAATASAEGFLPTYQVTEVSADDVLNIRAEPDPQADIVGTYDPYVQHIEVLRTSPDGKWGLVGVAEQNGWTAMRFLEEMQHPADSILRPLHCFGTEPFWSLELFLRGDAYHALGDTRRTLTQVSERLASNGAIAVFEEGPSLTRTLIVERGYCDDGMRDREFGMRATLFNDTPDGSTVQSGCCTGDASR